MRILFETEAHGELVGYLDVYRWRVVVRTIPHKIEEKDPVVQILCPCCGGERELTFECNRGTGCEHTVDCDTCDAQGWCDLYFDGEHHRFQKWAGLDLVVSVPEEVCAVVRVYEPPDPRQLDMWKKDC